MPRHSKQSELEKQAEEEWLQKLEAQRQEQERMLREEQRLQSLSNDALSPEQRLQREIDEVLNTPIVRTRARGQVTEHSTAPVTPTRSSARASKSPVTVLDVANGCLAVMFGGFMWFTIVIVLPAVVVGDLLSEGWGIAIGFLGLGVVIWLAVKALGSLMEGAEASRRQEMLDRYYQQRADAEWLRKEIERRKSH